MTTMINFQIYPETRKELRMFKEANESEIRIFTKKTKGKITYDDAIKYLISTVERLETE